MAGFQLLELSSVAAGQIGPSALGLIGVGAIEQHGPHLPLGTDAMIAQSLARSIAEALPRNVILCPCPLAGISSHHLDFPGTVTIAEAGLVEQLDALVQALQDLHVADIAVFSAHGGNFAALEAYGRGRSVRTFSDLTRYFETMMAAGTSAGLELSETDIHAGALETSQMLALHPELVGPFADVDGLVDPTPGWREQVWSAGVKSLTTSGVLGNPRGATPAAGHAINTALVRMFVSWISA